MSNSEDFPAYFTCKEDGEGRLTTFHVCSGLTPSREWAEKQVDSIIEKGPPKSDGLVGAEFKSASENEESFSDIIDRLMSSLMSFYDLIDIIATVRSIFPNLFIEREFHSFRRELPEVDRIGDYTILGVPPEKVSSLNRKIRRLYHIKDGISSIPANVLMGLVARFDANISRLVRYLLYIRKEKLANSDRAIPVKDILSANSFDDLISDLIDDEIHSLMRGSHEDQIKYIEDNFSIKIRDGFELWPQFIEIFERRNLAAHGEGYVNSRYDRICSKAKVPNDFRLPFRERVTFNDKYLRRSTDILLEFSVLLTWWIWLKHEPDDTLNAYNKINSATYEMIHEKRYRLASRILKSCLSRRSNDSPEYIRRMMTVNLANCLKKLDDAKGFEEAISMFDWSASSDEFKISVASLRGDLDTVCALMPRVVSDELVGKSGLREWPVFDWVRDDDRFCQTFRELFGEPVQLPKIGDNRTREGEAAPKFIEGEVTQDETENNASRTISKTSLH